MITASRGWDLDMTGAKIKMRPTDIRACRWQAWLSKGETMRIGYAGNMAALAAAEQQVETLERIISGDDPTILLRAAQEWLCACQLCVHADLSIEGL
jgi:hypothetical protein